MSVGGQRGALPGGAGGGRAGKRAGAAEDTEPAKMARAGHLYDRAAELGLCGPLGERLGDQWEGERGSDGRGRGAALVEQLRDSVKRRMMRQMDVGRVGTALSWFADFRRDTTRVPFMPLGHAGDLTAGAYNAETLDLMAEYMRLRGPRRGGEGVLGSDHIQACVSTVRLLRSAEAHYGVVVPEANTASTTMHKDMRGEQGPVGERRECRAFRARDMRAALASGHDVTSPRGAREWAIALVAHNLLLRGGEVGRCMSKPFDPARDLTLLSVEIQVPCRESGWRRWLIVWVVSIKDLAMRHRAVPLVILERERDGEGGRMCAYTQLTRHLAERMRAVPRCAHTCAWCHRRAGTPRPGGNPPARCQRANTPLFSHDDGRAYCTEDVRQLGKRMAEAAGIPPEAVGGKLFRIGGATDLRDMLGPGGQRLIKERGRWGTDVAFVYVRALLSDELRASGAMADADSADLEAVVAGWVQPSTFR